MKGFGSPGRGPPMKALDLKNYERSGCCEEWYGYFRYLPPAQAGV